MSKETAVIVLGLWVVVLPYLGIYRSWLSILMVLTGIALMLIGFLLRGESLARTPGQGGLRHSDHSFVENEPPAPEAPAAHEHHEGISSLN